jgi:hypothetical protein
MGDTVSLTTEVEGLPIGSEGKVILANGFNWLRYRIRFANGTEIGNLDHRHLKTRISVLSPIIHLPSLG